MGENRDIDGPAITEAAKQAGAEAFAKAMGQGTYDALQDERLSAEIMRLWDCESVEELQAQASAGDRRAGFVLKAARAAYVTSVCAVLGTRQTQRIKQGR